jgi:hypothetical protein
MYKNATRKKKENGKRFIKDFILLLLFVQLIGGRERFSKKKKKKGRADCSAHLTLQTL